MTKNKKFYKDYLIKAKQIVSKMSLEEQIGQMLLPTSTLLIPDKDVTYSSELTDNELINQYGLNEIKKYHIGSILVGGGDLPFNANDPSLEMWQKFADICKKLYNGPAGTEILLGTDAVHGNQHITGEVLFPHNIGLGATHNPELIRKTAELTAEDIIKSGFNWSFAPTVAVPQDYRWGRTYEAFSQDTKLIKIYSESYIKGLQKIKGNKIAGVLASVKHFIGDGDTVDGLDEGNTIYDDFEVFWKKNGLGYEGAIKEHAGSMMISYNSLNGLPMHFGGDNDLINKIRKSGINGYKFNGFVVSDYAGISKAQSKYNALSNKKLSFPDALAISINAGIDMIMVGEFCTSIPPEYSENFIGKINQNNPFNNEKSIEWQTNPEGNNYSCIGDLFSAVKLAVEYKKISPARISEAVEHIIAVKLSLKPIKSEYNNRKIINTALKSAEQSLILLKNESVIPLQSANIKNVITLGACDDIGLQNGGWTVFWQGVTGNDYWKSNSEWKKTSGAVSILDGIKNSLNCNTIYYTDSNISKDDIENLNPNETIAIVTISESPYAEYKGDIDNNNPLFEDDHEDCFTKYPQEKFLGLTFDNKTANLVKKLKAINIKIVTVVFSGRPLVLTEGEEQSPLKNSDALIAAWLPGTTGGQAIANAIFGNYKFKSHKSDINGKAYCSNTLPFDWPENMDEIRNYNCTFFKSGFGLKS
jgi:beta-glucosidase